MKLFIRFAFALITLIACAAVQARTPAQGRKLVLSPSTPLTISTADGTYFTLNACQVTTGKHAALAECSQDDDLQFSYEAGQLSPTSDLEILVVDFAAGPVWEFTDCTTIDVGVYSCTTAAQI